MNKLKATLLAIGAILAIPAAYFYKPFEIDFLQIGVAVAVTLITLLTYLKIRKNTRSKAASTAVRRSAGASGVRKMDQKMFIWGIIPLAVLLIVLKGTFFLIPLATAALAYLLYRLFNVKVLLPIGYMAAIFAATAFSMPYSASLPASYSLIVEAVIWILFLFVILPTADLFVIEG